MILSAVLLFATFLSFHPVTSNETIQLKKENKNHTRHGNILNATGEKIICRKYIDFFLNYSQCVPFISQITHLAISLPEELCHYHHWHPLSSTVITYFYPKLETPSVRTLLVLLCIFCLKEYIKSFLNGYFFRIVHQTDKQAYLIVFHSLEQH